MLALSAQNETILRYYLSQWVGEEKSTDMTLVAHDPKNLASFVRDHPEVSFVFLSRETTADVRAILLSLGFRQKKIAQDSDFLFVRR